VSAALVVPIRVEALPVGTGDDARCMGPYADFAAVAGRYSPYVGAQVVNRLFSGGRPFEPGIHVHWHLPRGLLSSPVTARQPLPPPAPDRWLVVRAPADPARSEAFLVESNYLHDEPLYSETTFPGDVQNGERPFSYLGRVYRLSDWPGHDEGASYLDGLTGFGYGLPAFAGSYANCRNVFGLHDREPGAGPHGYAVVGWHHDPAQDPLRDGVATLLRLGWDLPKRIGGPERTLYFGAVRGVPFDPEAAHLAGHTQPLTSTVAIGNTPAEALAALAEPDDDVAGRTRQRLFTAYQIGALRRLGDLAGVDEQVHAAGFASVDTGSTWELQAAAGDQLGEVTAQLASDLGELNRSQRAFDLLRAEQTTLRRRIFADWYRRTELRAARWRPEIDLDGLDALIERQIVVLDDQQAQLEGQVWEIATQRRRLRVALPEHVRLVRNAAPRFHRPNDPVLVLAGDGIVAPAPDVKDRIACGCTDGEPDAVPGLDGAERLPHPEAAQLAWAGAHGETELPVGERAIALREWELPWRPVELAWRVALELPNELDGHSKLAPRLVLESYALDEQALDFSPTSDDFSSLPDAYEGRTPLAANATAALEVQLKGVIAEPLLRQLRETPIVAQSLGGFTHALTMLDQTLQLPVADPGGSPLEEPFVRRVAAAVGDEARFGPLGDNPFTPLRSGRFTPTALRLVDEFGRWRDVHTSELRVSETIPRRGRALLPPLRLSQAAQLRFRWRIAGRYAGEASVAPAGSPICGWVVPNRLDGGILLYAGDGKPIGRLVPGADDDEPEWFGPPSADDAPGLADALAAHNAVLAGFGLSLLNDRSRYLRALTATLDATRSYVAPALVGADRELGMLVGTPLALVQAELDLSLLGLPAIDMSLDALRADIAATGSPLDRSDRDASRVQFGVRLGNLHRADDGLIGFFGPGAGGEPDFGTFFADADGEHDAIHPAAPDTLTLTSDPAAAPLVVTLLIDPRCPVHAATGILPIKSLAIPGDLVTRSLAAVEYTFPIGPLIVPSDRIGAPAPGAAPGWRWLERDGHRWHEPEPLAALDPGLPPSGRQRIVDGWLLLSRETPS